MRKWNQTGKIRTRDDGTQERHRRVELVSMTARSGYDGSLSYRCRRTGCNGEGFLVEHFCVALCRIRRPATQGKVG